MRLSTSARGRVEHDKIELASWMGHDVALLVLVLRGGRVGHVGRVAAGGKPGSVGH